MNPLLGTSFIFIVTAVVLLIMGDYNLSTLFSIAAVVLAVIS